MEKTAPGSHATVTAKDGTDWLEIIGQGLSTIVGRAELEAASTDDERITVLRNAALRYTKAYRKSLYQRFGDQWARVDLKSGLSIWLQLGQPVGMEVVAGAYEVPFIRLILSQLRPGGLFLDIGANIGWFTLNACAHFRSIGRGRVLAFEPQPSLQQKLADSIKINNFEDMATVHALALADTSGVIAMTGRDDRGTFHLTSGDDAKLTDIPMRRMDELDCDWTDLCCIKIDIEGAEPRWFQGARSILEKHKPFIVSEVNNVLTQRVSGVEALDFVRDVAAIGYDVRTINRKGLLSEPVDLASFKVRDGHNLAFTPR